MRYIEMDAIFSLFVTGLVSTPHKTVSKNVVRYIILITINHILYDMPPKPGDADIFFACGSLLSSL